MLSILIPVFNYAIEPLVLCLRKQATLLDVPWEIIVCEDASTDSEAREANRNLANLNGIFYFENQTNIGRMATRNRLAAKAQYPWLLFLDADVMPPDDSFLMRYVSFFEKDFELIMGGFAYQAIMPKVSLSLRWKFGRNRESIKAVLRNKRPYRVFISANYLIKKTVYLDVIASLNIPSYGSDSAIAAVLLSHKIKVLHIDNPVWHLGLEENTFFLEKTRSAIRTLQTLASNNPGFSTQNKLYNVFLKVTLLRCRRPIAFFFKLFRVPMEKQLTGKNPALFLFDLYRLGYLCHLYT
ncbi:MAG: glycosyltransferase [Flavobacteriaceae bacterium]|nr:glycosyltransferase [Flavobacteriaceae bacterium]